MSLSITIPQLFYDLIARVLPGHLFLILLTWDLGGSDLELIAFLPMGSYSATGLLLSAAGWVVLSYFVGWILQAATFASLEKEEQQKVEGELKENEPSLSRMYHWIRIESAAVGFRIIKLRAEARMIEVSRTGMCYLAGLALFLAYLSLLPFTTVPSRWTGEWLAQIGLPIILALAFRRLERRAWRNYFGNIPPHYRILVMEKSSTANRTPRAILAEAIAGDKGIPETGGDEE